MPRTANFVGFYLIWIACVWGGARHLPWLGPVVGTPFVVWHVAKAPRPKHELGFLALVTGGGAIVDSLLSDVGWYRFASPGWGGLICPVWMITLWAVYATTLKSSLGWLRSRLWLAASLGAVSGPASYWTGQRLGAIELSQPFRHSLAVLALVWAAVVPLSLLLARESQPRGGETTG